jgi:hypothetical protein
MEASALERPPSEAVLGLFQDADGVARGVDALRAAGIRDFKVLTDSPYPEGAFGEEPEKHRLYVFPFAGAACGFSVGLLITVATQMAYPMVTGGKPILSIPPMINVMYEGTMLGAILFTVLGIIFESRLPDFSRAPYDPRINEGYLGLLVGRTDGRTSAVEQALRDAGAIDIVDHRSGRTT